MREMTKPMFAIPTHQFLFNPGNISKKEYMEMLRLDEDCLFDLISSPLRGVCVFRPWLRSLPSGGKRHRSMKRICLAVQEVSRNQKEKTLNLSKRKDVKGRDVHDERRKR
ncbi:MAG: hypothetical protein ACLTW9_22255 [Enterocloster sp.]